MFWGACVMNSGFVWVSQQPEGINPSPRHLCLGWEGPQVTLIDGFYIVAV